MIVEGYWSAMRLHQEGIPAVATMGTSISTEQVKLLTDTGYRFATVLYDGDEQGRKEPPTIPVCVPAEPGAPRPPAPTR